MLEPIASDHAQWTRISKPNLIHGGLTHHRRFDILYKPINKSLSFDLNHWTHQGPERKWEPIRMQDDALANKEGKNPDPEEQVFNVRVKGVMDETRFFCFGRLFFMVRIWLA